MGDGLRIGTQSEFVNQPDRQEMSVSFVVDAWNFFLIPTVRISQGCCEGGCPEPHGWQVAVHVFWVSMVVTWGVDDDGHGEDDGG